MSKHWRKIFFHLRRIVFEDIDSDFPLFGRKNKTSKFVNFIILRHISRKLKRCFYCRKESLLATANRDTKVCSNWCRNLIFRSVFFMNYNGHLSGIGYLPFTEEILFMIDKSFIFKCVLWHENKILIIQLVLIKYSYDFQKEGFCKNKS